MPQPTRFEDKQDINHIKILPVYITYKSPTKIFLSFFKLRSCSGRGRFYIRFSALVYGRWTRNTNKEKLRVEEERELGNVVGGRKYDIGGWKRINNEILSLIVLKFSFF
jgi:hypothetical protein